MNDHRKPITEELWVCKICRRPLDLYEEVDPDDNSVLDFRFQHTAFDTRTDNDHSPDPVRASDSGGEVVGICDFCSGKYPTWSYPCKTFDLIGAYNSVGDWAACTPCHRDIGRANWKAVLKRALDTYPVERRSIAKDMVTQLHTDFRNNRTGPAQRI